MLLLIPILLSVSTTQVECYQRDCLTSTRSDLSGLRVAVFNGSARGTKQVGVIASRTALAHMYAWMGATVDILNASYIRNYGLGEYDIIAMPGDHPLGTGLELGDNGTKVVRDFIANGGSYLGVCGGAMFACTTGEFYGEDYNYALQLFNGGAFGPVPEVDSPGLTTLNINTSCSRLNLSDSPDTLDVLFYGGGYYTPNVEQEMTTIAQYPDGKAAIIVFEYENGCVCLSGPHPEWEENSERDGTDFMSHYDDSDTEWDLMKQISLWQVETSTWVTPTESTTPSSTNMTTTTNTEVLVLDPILLSLLIAGGFGVVLIVLILLKRR